MVSAGIHPGAVVDQVAAAFEAVAVDSEAVAPPGGGSHEHPPYRFALIV